MKKIIFVLFASLLVLSACGNDESKEEKKTEQKEEKKAEKKEKKQENKSSEEAQASTSQNSTEENTTVNNSQQPTSNESQDNVNQGQQAQSGQQIAKQKPNQPNLNSEEYQRYLDAQALTQDMQNNPQKYENAHIGGGPGLTSPTGETFQQYQERVNNGGMPSK
ncbi:membrane lipoprotein lipid attachment site-containing protein [Staphylococcus hyicus]|uniref:membrane lipoprotein lipid attachment site-containing protein n=1 Tax=Staphylococcus hyicus TaxID=1284 RepID=UPI0023658348|nr:membrane lipoprotein lipid attachment site-containing protein [Staphylococcus hyicus]